MTSRKYEVTLPNGKTVSRQYAHQLKHPKVYKDRQKKYYEENREALILKTRLWMEKFKEEHGMTYYEWRRQQKEKDATTTSVSE